jgi:hypothetical protein
MFTEGTKEIVCNSMHARIPNGIIRRNIWLNFCIDIQSFVNECFQTKQQPSTGLNGLLPTANIYKFLEQIQIEGIFKIRKVFTSRS